MSETLAPLTIPQRFRGPARSGNGGWSAGAIAAYLAPGPVTVRLRMPPPLDVPIAVELGAGEDGAERAVATHDGAVIGEARYRAEALTTVAPVPLDVARAAGAGYPGHDFHPFPTCFSCGTGREEGDGLRIFPGQVADDTSADPAGRTRVAATWTPHPSLGDPAPSFAVTWAALDCIGGWAGDLAQRLMVLGEMTAEVLDLPATGAEHVVVGAKLRSEGRRTWTAATLYSPAGDVLARAEHVWVAVDPDAFN